MGYNLLLRRVNSMGIPSEHFGTVLRDFANSISHSDDTDAFFPRHRIIFSSLVSSRRRRRRPLLRRAARKQQIFRPYPSCLLHQTSSDSSQPRDF